MAATLQWAQALRRLGEVSAPACGHSAPRARTDVCRPQNRRLRDGCHVSGGLYSAARERRQGSRPLAREMPLCSAPTAPHSRTGHCSTTGACWGREAGRAARAGQALTSPSAVPTCTKLRAARGPQRAPRAAVSRNGGQAGFPEDDDYPLEIPTRFELSQRPDKQKPLVRVRLSVHYRVHSRQMLCIGGSQIPLGWSFLSIAKVPMTWNSGDIWTCEVELQAGQWIEYKYVILEEQDWTKLENEDAQGLVEITYRTGDEPGRPPDVQVIQKQMAIVAWQPGPNRTLKVPNEAELRELKPGQAIERIPAPPGQRIPYQNTTKRAPPLKPDPFEGTWEVLTLDEEQRPLLDRHDVWGWTPPGQRGSGPGAGAPGSSGGPAGGTPGGGPPPPSASSSSSSSSSSSATIGRLRGLYLGR